MSQAPTPPVTDSPDAQPIQSLLSDETLLSPELIKQALPDTPLTDPQDLDQLHLPDVPLPPAVNTLKSLLEIRESQGRTVEEMAGMLRLSQMQIHALEQCRWDALPGAAYVKGFLRNYTRALGVDAQPYIEQYMAQIPPPASAELTHTGAANAINHSSRQHPPVISSSPYAPSLQSMQTLGSSTASKTTLLGEDILKNDPQTLPAFSHSGESDAGYKPLIWGVFALISTTAVFLLFWERQMWMPVVIPKLQSLIHWGDTEPKNAPVAAATADLTPDNLADRLNKTTLPQSASSHVPSAEPLAEKPSNGNNTSAAAVGAVSTTVRAQQTATEAASSNADADAQKAINQEPKKPATGPLRGMELQFLKPVWIEVRDSAGNILSYGTKLDGKQLLKGNAPLSVVIGAVDAVKITLDGKPFDLQAKSQGNVARFTIQ